MSKSGIPHRPLHLPSRMEVPDGVNGFPSLEVDEMAYRQWFVQSAGPFVGLASDEQLATRRLEQAVKRLRQYAAGR